MKNQSEWVSELSAWDPQRNRFWYSYLYLFQVSTVLLTSITWDVGQRWSVFTQFCWSQLLLVQSLFPIFRMSQNIHLGTPQELKDTWYKKYDLKFDVCPLPNDRKPEWDALKCVWPDGFYSNPPFCHSKIFTKRCHNQCFVQGKRVVMLLPFRPSRDYWQQYIYGHAKVIPLQSRIKFDNYNNANHHYEPKIKMLCVYTIQYILYCSKFTGDSSILPLQ